MHGVEILPMISLLKTLLLIVFVMLPLRMTLSWVFLTVEKAFSPIKINFSVCIKVQGFWDSYVGPRTACDSKIKLQNTLVRHSV